MKRKLEEPVRGGASELASTLAPPYTEDLSMDFVPLKKPKNREARSPLFALNELD